MMKARLFDFIYPSSRHHPFAFMLARARALSVSSVARIPLSVLFVQSLALAISGRVVYHHTVT
jgi:hypothetical protein